jgi:hypothetical protein
MTADDEIHNLQVLPHIILAGYVARMGDEKCPQNFSRKTWREETTWKT